MRAGNAETVERHVDVINGPVESLLQAAQHSGQVRDDGDKPPAGLQKPGHRRYALRGLFKMLNDAHRQDGVKLAEKLPGR